MQILSGANTCQYYSIATQSSIVYSMPTGHRSSLASPPVLKSLTPTPDNMPAEIETRSHRAFPAEPQASQAHHPHSFEFEEANNKKQNHWSAPFCVEPREDVATCCLGFWVPSCMYSRVEWRLREARHNRDPLAWNNKNGCDGTCCAHFALTMFCGLGCKWR